ncbi:hypothetical protein [Mesorhizobium argentiipisi]|uniref:Uncharacterized protein n=2 Tax=Mesorhizobium TaxID=68287 RepID=A0ABU8KNI6_9HYPH
MSLQPWLCGSKNASFHTIANWWTRVSGRWLIPLRRRRVSLHIREEFVLMDQRIDISIQPDDQPYEVTSFARKHGLTIPVADAVLFAKGPSPSRAACDTAALAFLCAVARYAGNQGRR